MNLIIYNIRRHLRSIARQIRILTHLENQLILHIYNLKEWSKQIENGIKRLCFNNRNEQASEYNNIDDNLYLHIIKIFYTFCIKLIDDYVTRLQKWISTEYGHVVGDARKLVTSHYTFTLHSLKSFIEAKQNSPLNIVNNSLKSHLRSTVYDPDGIDLNFNTLIQNQMYKGCDNKTTTNFKSIEWTNDFLGQVIISNGLLRLVDVYKFELVSEGKNIFKEAVKSGLITCKVHVSDIISLHAAEQEEDTECNKTNVQRHEKYIAMFDPNIIMTILHSGSSHMKTRNCFSISRLATRAETSKVKPHVNLINYLNDENITKYYKLFKTSNEENPIIDHHKHEGRIDDIEEQMKKGINTGEWKYNQMYILKCVLSFYRHKQCAVLRNELQKEIWPSSFAQRGGIVNIRNPTSFTKIMPYAGYIDKINTIVLNVMSVYAKLETLKEHSVFYGNMVRGGSWERWALATFGSKETFLRHIASNIYPVYECHVLYIIWVLVETGDISLVEASIGASTNDAAANVVDAECMGDASDAKNDDDESDDVVKEGFVELKPSQRTKKIFVDKKDLTFDAWYKVGFFIQIITVSILSENSDSIVDDINTQNSTLLDNILYTNISEINSIGSSEDTNYRNTRWTLFILENSSFKIATTLFKQTFGK
jgi:hypothetical protein